MNTQNNHLNARADLNHWQKALKVNIFTNSSLFAHSLKFILGEKADEELIKKLQKLGSKIVNELEAKVAENDFRLNLPRIESYDGIGNFTNKIKHHPFYQDVGDGIYETGMMQHLTQAGQLTQSLILFYLTSHLGEAGHNCPVACTAGVIRVLNHVGDFPQKQAIIDKLIAPSFKDNFTGAQFVTEVQGGSDVGQNSCIATQSAEGDWLISGEKWFCSNANADIILMTARFDSNIKGTKGLGLFLVPRINSDGTPNNIKIRRLKEKMGTRAMASAEIDFDTATAIAMGEPKNGFKLLMQNVLHLSRIYNSFAILGACSRAYQVARSYAKYRQAFSTSIENYPLVQEALADVKASNCAMLASCLETTKRQDKLDCNHSATESEFLLLRMRANINKYVTAKKCVDNIHKCIDVLAGNGMIETFSPLPRLYRDALVYENWEGTHNTLRMQILRDMHKYNIHKIFTDDLTQKLQRLKTRVGTAYCDWVTCLQNSLSKQSKIAEDLLLMSPKLQSLAVRDYIDEMACIDVCIHLFAEAADAYSTENNAQKYELLQWMLIRTNHIKMTQYSEDWLALAAQII